MTCPYCGTALDESDHFCSSCGASMQGAQIAVQSEQPRVLRSPQIVQQKAAARATDGTRSQYARDDYRLMGAYNRSFTTPAVITLVLYFVLWVPGFIANIVYLIEANKIQQVTGEAPEGKGCLVAMIVVFTISLILGCLFWASAMGILTSAGTSG